MKILNLYKLMDRDGNNAKNNPKVLLMYKISLQK